MALQTIKPADMNLGDQVVIKQNTLEDTIGCRIYTVIKQTTTHLILAGPYSDTSNCSYSYTHPIEPNIKGTRVIHYTGLEEFQVLRKDNLEFYLIRRNPTIKYYSFP